MNELYILPLLKHGAIFNHMQLRPLITIPPDASRTVDYAPFPDVDILPYHYPNPVTDKSWSNHKEKTA